MSILKLQILQGDNGLLKMINRSKSDLLRQWQLLYEASENVKMNQSTLPNNKTVKEKINKSDNNSDNFPILGIGTLAGVITAFEAFFSGLPTTSDPGMVFIQVYHLVPDHKSILIELINDILMLVVSKIP